MKQSLFDMFNIKRETYEYIRNFDNCFLFTLLHNPGQFKSEQITSDKSLCLRALLSHYPSSNPLEWFTTRNKSLNDVNILQCSQPASCWVVTSKPTGTTYHTAWPDSYYILATNILFVCSIGNQPVWNTPPHLTQYPVGNHISNIESTLINH